MIPICYTCISTLPEKGSGEAANGPRPDAGPRCCVREAGASSKVLPGESRECLLRHHRRGEKTPVESGGHPLCGGNESFLWRGGRFCRGRRRSAGARLNRASAEAGAATSGWKTAAGAVVAGQQGARKRKKEDNAATESTHPVAGIRPSCARPGGGRHS